MSPLQEVVGKTLLREHTYSQEMWVHLRSQSHVRSMDNKANNTPVKIVLTTAIASIKATGVKFMRSVRSPIAYMLGMFVCENSFTCTTPRSIASPTSCRGKVERRVSEWRAWPCLQTKVFEVRFSASSKHDMMRDDRVHTAIRFRIMESQSSIIILHNSTDQER